MNYLDYFKISKYQKGNKVVPNWATGLLVGDPMQNAVLTSTGLNINSKGGTSLVDYNSGDRDKLRKGMLESGIQGALDIFGGPIMIKAFEKVTPAVKPVLQSIKSRFARLRPTSDITERFLKFVGSKGNATGEPHFGFGEKDLELLAEKLKESGVDVSRISKQDLQKALDLRQDLILKSGPERFTITAPDKDWGNTVVLLEDMYKGENVGEMQLMPHSDGIHIGNVSNISKKTAEGLPTVHKVHERGINSATQVAKDLNKDGVISGEVLKSPESTVNVYKHYPDKVQIRDNGIYEWSNHNPEMEDAFGPVYRIKNPSFEVPTKSIIFDPKIINKYGKMQINWKNPSIFKSIVPAAIVGTGVKSKG